MIICAWLSILFLNRVIGLGEKLFYVYDWPNLVERYANYSDRSHHGHGVEIPHWRLNFGAGRSIDKKNFEFKTSQFALYKLMFQRALVDHRRTTDPSKATTFFIPYDFGMDATFFETNGRMRRTQCPLSSEALTLLKESSYFNRNFGHDHVLVVSTNQNMNYFFTAAPCTNFLLNCWNCTKLAIDEYLFSAQDRDFELKNRGINWHAVPFPSDYHYDATVTDSVPPWQTSNDNRTHLISFLGNPRKFSKTSTSIREALVEQCGNHTLECRHGWYRHELEALSPNYESRHAVFSLQPPGDMPSRKSVFDSILSGCIPVFFHPLTAKYMYEWHFGQKIWDEIGIHFDSVEDRINLISHKVDYIKKLIDFYHNHPDIVNYKRQKIRELAYQLQYSLVYKDPMSEKNVPSIQYINNTRMNDAFDISINNLLNIHSGEDSHKRKSDYLRCDFMKGQRGVKIQTVENCVSIGSNVDPFGPVPSIVDFF